MKYQRTDAELNEVIAKWMGWTFVHESGPFAEFPDPEHWVDQNGKAQSHFFCEDLNAVHEAWSALPDDKKHRFQNHLQIVLLNSDDNRWLVGANSRQRAEALVKVIEEGEK